MKFSDTGLDNQQIHHVRVMYTLSIFYCQTGVYTGIPIFLSLIQNIDCWYSLEPPCPGSNKSLSIFHGHVFVCTQVKKVQVGNDQEN